MEFVLGIIIGLAVGLALRKNNREGSSEAELRRRIGLQLEASAQAEKSSLADGIRRAALQVTNPELYGGNAKVVAEDSKPESLFDSEPAAAGTAEEGKSQVAKSKEIDNVSVLLYFGAFLVISGVGLFVGLSDFSGGVKTFAVLVMALTFYAAGLAMYGALPRLRPAAIALTAIGLVCLPLTGVAAYYYLSSEASGATIWFVTSLVSLVLYGVALWQIRQSLMGYLSVFMCVSLWLSIVSVVDAPVYFFGWAAILLAMIYVAAVKFWKPWAEVEAPLSVSASVMVPVALIATIFLGQGEVSLTHQGITALLAAAFYALALWREVKPDLQQSYFALGYLLVPLGLLLIAVDVLDGVWVSYALTTVVIAQFVATLKLQKSHDSWRQSAVVVSGLGLGVSTIATIPLFSGEWATYVWVLALNTALSGLLAFWQRDRLHMSLALVGLLILPSVLGFLVFEPDWPKLTVVLVYAGLAVALMLAGRYLKKWQFNDLTMVTYVAALVAAWSIGIAGPAWLGMTTSLIVGAVVLAMVYYERLPQAIYAAALLGAVSMGFWLVLQDSQWGGVATIMFGLLGIAYYIAGKLSASLKTEPAYGEAWLVSGLATLYLAAPIPLFGAEVTWETIGCLTVAGALTGYEAYIRRERFGQYAAGAVAVIALQLALHKFGVEEFQVYSHIWAAYFAVLALWAHVEDRLADRHALVITALSVLTVPLALEALGGDNGYGLLLLFESVAILLFGLWARYPLISWWGLSVAVGSVLYQLREFQFFVLALLGVGIISLGVVLLLRQEKNKGN
ncbi:MAG TPA: hypothetical protein VJM46_03625 [Candidatus Saccharimonadales bacterium]|nr:hypothetical protein [Candidatus Saccharimonadales bacterium]